MGEVKATERYCFPFHEIMSETVIVNSLENYFSDRFILGGKLVLSLRKEQWEQEHFLLQTEKKIFNLNSIPYTL